jgi:hypothetical protein
MSFFNVYYITLCKLYEKHLILSEVKNWQVCYSGLVTLVVVHYILDLPIGHCNVGSQIVGKWEGQEICFRVSIVKKTWDLVVEPCEDNLMFMKEYYGANEGVSWI